MGYISIQDYYKYKSLELFKRVWATEKIHGTSAWITYKEGQLFFHPGEKEYGKIFLDLFSSEALLSKLQNIFGEKEVRLHGEFYGGKIQRMSKVYGDYGFALFDILVDGMWLSFDKIHDLGRKLDLYTVEGVIIENDKQQVEEQTNKPSKLALDRGMGKKIREGIVIRPLEEFRTNNGRRVIAKHKTAKYAEVKTPRQIFNPNKLEILKQADKIAFEWVTSMRLSHILTNLSEKLSRRDTSRVIFTMIADVQKEGQEEIIFSTEVRKAIAKRTVKIFHEYLEQTKNDS